MARNKKSETPSEDDQRDIPDWVRREIWSKADSMAVWVRRATKPLVLIQGKRVPTAVGSSVLLAIEGNYFLLTARHVLDQFEGLPINIMSPPKWASITGRHHKTVFDTDGIDDFDAAVFEIDEHRVTDEMRESAITPSHLDRTSAKGAQIIGLVGYPASRFENVSGTQLIPSYLQWTGSALTDEELRERGHTPGRHVGFDFEPDKAVDADGTGKRSPKLSGVSGSGMWLLPKIGETTIDGKEAKLTAIFTDYRPVKRPTYMLGTSVAAHMAILLRYRPELRPFA